jgi:tetratricopeptide (TPR) repeat protein/predicted aspartyl protease
MSEPVRGNRGLRPCLPCLRRAAWVFGLMICAAGAPALAASGKCKLGKMVEFPVTMNQMAPETEAKINGTDVRFMIDSGSFYSSLDAGSAASLKLHVYPAPVGFYGQGVGGHFSLSIASVNDFTLPGVTLHNLEFVVGGSHLAGQAVGVVGRNILQIADAEYDFASGVARLMKAEDCSDVVLAYWLRPGDSYSVIKIIKPEQSLETGSHVVMRKEFQHPVIAIAYVNGASIRAMFDTGASSSFLTLKAAAKAGIKVDSPGTVSAGYVMGSGQSTVQTYVAPVAVFKIGDEEVRNTRLRLGDTDLPEADMLIGADFFLSHHVYVANSQDKLYFSYNGGPVFNLAAQRPAGSVPSTAAPAAQASAATSPAESKEPVESKEPGGDASEYARRGAALKARQQLDQALEAFNRACELAPGNADYFYQRALLYAQLKQSGPALADLDRTIQLEPHHVAALLVRAGYRTESGDKTGAEADLDAANAVLPKEDNERLTLASEYSRLDLFPRAIEQYGLWIDSHREDVRLADAFEGRCRARTLGDMDLQRAVKDCDTALRHAAKASPLYAQISGTRGLLLLRLGDYDKSIAEYDASLKIAPKNASALYGRGIDKLRKQKAPEGQADIAQAIALSPEIADKFNRHGIAP